MNEEIDLEMDYIFNKTTDSSLIVNHTITINGNGHILNASNSNRILTINASNVILKNIIFTDGYLKTGNGAAIIWYGNGGTLENCTFTNNEAYYGNAALYLGADYVDVVNCTFKDNIASTAGALFWNGANGVLNNSIFVNNFADGNGAAVSWNGKNNTAYNGIITNCTFENNSCNGSGGAVAWYNENGVIKNCNFRNNYAKRNAGAFYSNGRNNVLINSSLFVNNSAKSGGGAIYWNSGWYCKVMNSTFINNSATNSGGGAISWVKENGTVINCTFICNNASFTGGAIYWANNGGIVNYCNFINNSDNRDGGAIYWSKCNNCILNNSFFENNSAKWDGSAIYYLYSNCSLNNCTFSSNSIFIYSGKINISNSNFTILNATSAIYNEGTLYLNNNTLNKNSSISNNANISSKVQIKILNNSYIILPSFTTVLNATILDDNNNSIIGDKFKFLVNTDEINADNNKNFISAEHTFAQVGLYNISLDCSCFSDYTLFNSSIHVFNPNEVMYMDVDNIQFMQNATINFFLPEDARGNITLIIGDENYTITLNESVKGSFSYNIENLSAGIYKVIANYSGDDIFSSNKVETILIVNNADPTLIISADDIAVDEVAKIDVNLSTAGNVTIYVADVNYTSDEGFVSISNLSVGTYYVFAVFEGNDNYNSVSNVTCFNVLTKPVNLTVEIKDRIYIYSDVNTTGDVLVKINSTTYYSYLLEGVASISIPTNLSKGSYEVVVNFLGNNKYSANITSSILTIERIKAEIKSVIAEHVFEGSQSLINVTMNSDESGLVIFEINGFNYTSVINDAHSLLYITLPISINNLTVYYDGDAKYDSADAVNTKIIVKSKVDSNIVIDDVLLDIGDSVVFTAKINDVSCDDVVFMINGVENNSISNVSAGNYIVTAIFYGNSSNKANSTSKVFNVKKIDTSIDVAHKLISTAVDLSAGEPGSNIYAILKDVNSNILANKTIQCSINGVKTNYVSDNQGRIILKSNFQEAKTYNLLFSFEGDEKYTSSSSSLKLTVTKKITSLSASTKKFKKSKKIKRFTVVLKTSKNINGKTYLKSGKKISLRVNKKIYTAKTNSKGQATFKFNKLNKK